MHRVDLYGSSSSHPCDILKSSTETANLLGAAGQYAENVQLDSAEENVSGAKLSLT